MNNSELFKKCRNGITRKIGTVRVVGIRRNDRAHDKSRGLLFMNEEVDIAILGAVVAVETVGTAAAAAG